MPIRRRVIFSILLLLLAGLMAAGWYVWTKGFTRSWRRLIAAEFERQGIELTLRRLTLDPFRGLVAQEVRLLDARDRRQTVAVIDEMLLGVNYAGWVRGQAFLDSVDLRDAELALPLDSSKSEATTVRISKLNARLFLPPKQIYLARAEAEIAGVQVYASGRLINTQALRELPRPSGKANPLVKQVLTVLGSLKYRGAAPVFSVNFSGDLEAPGEISVDARLYAESVKRHDYAVDQLFASASLRRGVLELQQLGANDRAGELRASATWELRTGQMSARVQSGLAVAELVRATEWRWPEEWPTLRSAPKLDLTVERPSVEGPWRVLGRVELGTFGFRKMEYRGLTTDVTWQGARWGLRDLWLGHQSGEVRGDVLALPGEVRAEMRGAMHPQALAVVLPKGFNEWLQRFEFVDAPHLQLELRGEALTPERCAATGEMRFGRTLYEGAPVQNFTAALRYREQQLSLAPFPKDGAADAELVFDLRTQETRVEKKQTGARAPARPHGSS